MIVKIFIKAFFLSFLAAPFLIAGAQVIVPSNGTLDVPASGVVDYGCLSMDVQGTVSLSGTLTGGNLAIGSGGLFNGNSGTVLVGGNWSNSGQFNPGASTVTLTGRCGTGNVIVSGTSVFNNLTVSSSHGATFVIPSGSNITVNGTLTLQGTQGNPISLLASTSQLAVISLGPNAQVVQSNTSLTNVQIGNAIVAQSIPTLHEYAMGLLVLLMSSFVALVMHRSRRKHIL